MGILLKPTLDCNMKCAYCYEHDTRSLGRHRYYDIDAMMKTARELYEATRDDICVHGGECLLMAKQDLERFLRESYRICGRSSLQTNASLIDDEHIRMFKKYKTSVGVSIDGPWPLNRGRSDEAGTNRIIANIARLKEAGVSVGHIIVLSKFNATEELRPQLKGFMITLKGMGLNGGRLNFVEARPDMELSPEEAKEAYVDLTDFILSEPGLQYQPFRDIVDNLCGFGLGTCIFTQCDFYATQAGKAVMGDGSLSSCLKTAKDGVPFIQAKEKTTTRYDILKTVPKEDGGCGGCRYWRICYGGCPSAAENDDWRNKSRYCEAFHATYELIEKRLKALLPNIELITEVKPEDPEKDYKERNSNQYSRRPYRLMDSTFTRCPSTWRERAKSERIAQQAGRQCRPQAGHVDQPHEDYSEHEDSGRA